MDSVYRGVWINWDSGPVKGLTLTVSERDGGLLISFIATFVTVAGAQLWRIIGFLAHQARSTDQPRDGLHHQQQVIFRNASTPGSAAWSFLLESWYWQGRAQHHFWKTLPWTLFGLFYLIAFGVLSTFSSQVSKSVGSARLLQGDNCGLWRLDSGAPDSEPAFQRRMTNESIISSTYARACYGSSPNRLSCGTYPVPALKYTTERNASCPFVSGMCVHGDTAAFKLTTEALSSHHHLGINTPSKYRVEIHKEVTCAPLIQRRAPINGSAGETDAGTEGHIFLRYFYGEIGSHNYTFQYNTEAMYTRVPYTVYTVNSFAPHGDDAARGWIPIDDLSIDAADVSLVFIAPNAIRFETPVDDPVFGAHYEVPLSGGGSYFEADEYNVAIGCTDMYRVCEPNSDKCTDRVGARQLTEVATRQLDLNTFQLAVVDRTMVALMVTGIYSQLSTRLAAALRAPEAAAGIFQESLPANQWELEVTGWFESGLARLQYLVQEYATGPSFVSAGSHVWSPGAEDLPALAMCYSQMINDPLGTSSFSVLGLAIVFSVGGLIILSSLVIDTLVGWLQTLLRKGVAKKEAWIQDDKLQMQRVVLERAGLGVWESRNGFPVTSHQDRFGPFHAPHEVKTSPSLEQSMAPPYTGFTQQHQGDTLPNIAGHKDLDVFVKEVPHT